MAMEWQEFYNKKRPHSSLNGKTLLKVRRWVEKVYHPTFL
ncbi:integrase core domain-containing protein [Parabacteroides distasonis]